MKISIAGNIGSGKSTLLEYVSKEHSVFYEPVEKWTLLSKFYRDMNRWAFPLQMQVLQTFLEMKKDGIYERSPQESFNIFTKTLYQSKCMSGEEYDTVKYFTNKYAWKPDITIYLSTDPKICFERIKQRNRNSETTIELDYIKKLHNLYENQNYDFIVDGNQPKEIVFNKTKNILNEVFGNSTGSRIQE